MEELPSVQLSNPEGFTAIVMLHGGHLVSWKSPSGEELIFLSEKAIFKPPKAIRGGCPICFPQFSDMGPVKASHGFARTSQWAVVQETSTASSVTLRLPGTTEQAADLRKDWPHAFELRLTIKLEGASISSRMEVRNVGEGPFEFTACLHTYLRVSDVEHVEVHGLSGFPHMDNTMGRLIRKPSPCGGPIEIRGEVDRIYLGAGAAAAAVHDKGSRRKVVVECQGMPDVVLWNPWADKAKALADMGDEEFRHMVCVEPAVAGSGAVEVAPGGSVLVGQRLTVSDL